LGNLGKPDKISQSAHNAAVKHAFLNAKNGVEITVHGIVYSMKGGVIHKIRNEKQQ